LGFSAITSGLTATIYFPLLPLLREQFHVSAQAINLTLTVYVVFQAISPIFFGPLADSYGRRPILLAALFIYTLGNIGLAVNKNNYVVLLVLRAVQSLGASAAWPIVQGVVVDISDASERGKMLGPINMILNLGPSVGPVLGGVVAYSRGDHVWVFWSLVIIGGILILSVAFLLPETCRRLVGDGSDLSLFKWWQLSGKDIILRRRASSAEAEKRTHANASPKDLAMNFVHSFRIIFYKDAFLALWVHGSFYAVDYSFVAAVPDIFKNNYDFNKLQLGLAYLPRAGGILAGSYVTGKLLDYHYRVTARVHGLSEERRGADLYHFPLEEARSRNSYWVLATALATMISYGWAVEKEAHCAVPLILQFMQGFWQTYIYTTYSTLVVDTFPKTPSTAGAATSITRCAMAAIAVAVLDPILNAVGRGVFFTMLAIWSCGCGVFAVVLLNWRGMQWRQARSEHSPVV
jgi:multidrug resistance protein